MTDTAPSSLTRNVSKKNRIIAVLVAVCILVILASISIRSLRAQSADGGLEVSPPSQEVAVDPGKTVTVKAKIRNKGNVALPIDVHVEDFTAKGDEGQVQLTLKGPYSVITWTTIKPASFILQPGDQQEVTATITAPAKAAGGHFGSFVFAVRPTSPNGQNAAGLSQEIASLFLVRVSGPVNEHLAISDFSAPQFSEFGPIPFTINYSNTGNVFVKAYGLVDVTDMFGNKVKDIVVTGINVFPGANRIVQPVLTNNWMIGKYTALAVIYYGSVENQTLTATTTFYVFPIRIAVGILIVLLLLFIMRKRIFRAMRELFK